MFALDQRGGFDQILPGGRPVGHPDLGPNALQIVAGIGDVVVAEAERQNGPIIDLCRRSTYNPVTRKWNAPGGDKNWNRSWPCWAATSALARVPRSASAMWSTVTSTPLAIPQSFAYLSNHTS